MTPVTSTQYGYSDTYFGFNWVYLTVKMTGYSDTPLIVILLDVPKGVTVSEEVCNSNEKVKKPSFLP